jgi:hypothetical protein
MVTMDFHAHLARSEIIGFLAGRWDESEKGMQRCAACWFLPSI